MLLSGQSTANIHVDFGTGEYMSGDACTLADFEANIYFLVTQQLIGDVVHR